MWLMRCNKCLYSTNCSLHNDHTVASTPLMSDVWVLSSLRRRVISAVYNTECCVHEQWKQTKEHQHHTCCNGSVNSLNRDTEADSPVVTSSSPVKPPTSDSGGEVSYKGVPWRFKDPDPDHSSIRGFKTDAILIQSRSRLATAAS